MGILTITELTRSVDGRYVQSPTRLEFTANAHSLPVGAWSQTTRVRSVRHDYPGTVEPVEHVMGYHFDEFTLSGTWDDKHMGAGEAVKMWRSLDELVRRAPMVSVSFDDIDYVGLIKHLKADYRRSDRIGYEFAVSPHTRDDIKPREVSSTGPISAVDHSAIVFERTTDMQTQMGTMPPFLIAAEKWELLSAKVEDAMRLAAAIARAVDQRSLSALGIEDPLLALRRITHAFQSMRTSIKSMHDTLEEMDSASDLIPSDGLSILGYDSWVRGLGWLGRIIALECVQAERELSQQAQPSALAVYRPREGESLYAVSQRHYGSPGGWYTIMQANGLTTTELTGREILLIPRMAAGA